MGLNIKLFILAVVPLGIAVGLLNMAVLLMVVNIDPTPPLQVPPYTVGVVQEPIKKEVLMYSQSYELMELDNLIFREDRNLVSVDKQYVDYKDVGNIIMLPDKYRTEYDITSNMVVMVEGEPYTVIDNHSNCFLYTDEVCAEILVTEQFTPVHMELWKGVVE